MILRGSKFMGGSIHTKLLQEASGLPMGNGAQCRQFGDQAKLSSCHPEGNQGAHRQPGPWAL